MSAFYIRVKTKHGALLLLLFVLVYWLITTQFKQLLHSEKHLNSNESYIEIYVVFYFILGVKFVLS